MTEDLHKLAGKQPFSPFTLHLADGRSFRVPTHDHIFIFPNRSTVIVVQDDGDYDILAGSLITGASVEGSLDP